MLSDQKTGYIFKISFALLKCPHFTSDTVVIIAIIIEENLQKAMVELLLNIVNDDPDSFDVRMEALKTIETVLRDAGNFAAEVKTFIDQEVVQLLPPEPPDPKVLAEMQAQKERDEAAEAERIRKEEEAAARKAAIQAKEDTPEPMANGVPEGQKAHLDRLQSQVSGGSRAGSRRGSADVVLGGSRRGSYYGDEITTKATVAMVVDDPDSKEKINALLDEGRKYPFIHTGHYFFQKYVLNGFLPEGLVYLKSATTPLFSFQMRYYITTHLLVIKFHK